MRAQALGSAEHRREKGGRPGDRPKQLRLAMDDPGWRACAGRSFHRAATWTGINAIRCKRLLIDSPYHGAMQPPYYEIETDIPRKLVCVTLMGFWDVAIAQCFARDQQAAVRQVSSVPHQHLILADLSQFNLQSQAVVAVCQDLIVKSPLQSRRLAVVAGEGLARIQIKRILLRERMKAFSDTAAAMAWLLDDDRPGQQAMIPSARVQ
jgi:hypothetical protein